MDRDYVQFTRTCFHTQTHNNVSNNSALKGVWHKLSVSPVCSPHVMGFSLSLLLEWFKSHNNHFQNTTHCFGSLATMSWNEGRSHYTFAIIFYLDLLFERRKKHRATFVVLHCHLKWKVSHLSFFKIHTYVQAASIGVDARHWMGLEISQTRLISKNKSLSDDFKLFWHFLNPLTCLPQSSLLFWLANIHLPSIQGQQDLHDLIC